MSLAKHTIANYCGRLYIVAANILILPLYFQYLGAAAFGLVNLYSLLQAFLELFDMGLTPSLTREVAYYIYKPNGKYEIKRFLRSIEIIILTINIVSITALSAGSYWIAHHWLKIESLDYNEVIACLVAMGFLICLHWFTYTYRSGITGLERLVWLNGASIFIVTLQYGGGYTLLRFISHQPIHFFIYQISVTLLEVLILKSKLYRTLAVSPHQKLPFVVSWDLIKKVLPFARNVFFWSVLWIIFTQFDRLCLSEMLTLSEYGYFSLVPIIANGALHFLAPISQAIIPRLTHLLAQGKTEEMLHNYRVASQLTAVILFSLTSVVGVFGSEVIYVWTGDKAAALWGGGVLFWYAIGNGFVAVTQFQYQLQFAYGKLKLQVMFNAALAVFSVPIVYLAAMKYGALGTGVCWFVMQAIVFIVWPQVVHAKFAPTIRRVWLTEDILPMAVTIVVMHLAIRYYMKMHHIDLMHYSRGEGFIFICTISLMILLASCLASQMCRRFMMKIIYKIRHNSRVAIS